MKWAFCLHSRWSAWIQAGSLLVVVGAAAAMRWYGLAWDQGYLFHPDERQILLVASTLSVPVSLADFFSASSPLNPHFFAYGSLPIYLLRLLGVFAQPLNLTGPWADPSLVSWVISGRAVSGLFDLGTIVLTFMIGRRLYTATVGLVAASCVAVSVLHIQLSHFYAVDTLLTCFVLFTLYAALRVAEGVTRLRLAICGIGFGLALATKISALPLAFPIVFCCYRGSLRSQAPPLGPGLPQSARAIWSLVRRPLAQVGSVALLVFVITQPYALLDWYEFGRDVIREGLAARGWLAFPYTLQYAHTLPYIYPIVQSTIWGMGLPLGFFGWGGAALFISNAWRVRSWRSGFLLSWGLIYFILIGAQYVKYPRYLLPLLPVLYLMAAHSLLFLGARRVLIGAALAFVFGLSLVYAIAFDSMYGREHPWLAASKWIYANARPGSTLLVEQWDDALPVPVEVGGTGRRASDYHSAALSVYDPDSSVKMQRLANALANADYYILASQRAYGSIGRLPDKYPLTASFYEKLFDGTIGYEVADVGTNEPEIAGLRIVDDPRAGLPFDMPLDPADRSSLEFDWGFADESLTVYDHPQPIILRNVARLSQPQLVEILER